MGIVVWICDLQQIKFLESTHGIGAVGNTFKRLRKDFSLLTAVVIDVTNNNRKHTLV
jgi:hypothetical protein